MVFGDVVRQKVLSLFFYILDFWIKVAGEKHLFFLKIHNNDEN